MPSSSARCSQLPRAVDKLPFYVALSKLRDHLCGKLPNLSDTEVTFPDLELKVEPKKERLVAEVKQEITDPATSMCLVSNEPGASNLLTVGIKMEDDLVAGKQRKGRRKRSSAVGGGGKESSVPSTVSSLAGTVCSPYFHPWQSASLCAADSSRTGYCATTASVDTTHQVKEEMPFDFAQFGHMPEDLTTRRTYSSMLPLPDVKPGLAWHQPANF